MVKPDVIIGYFNANFNLEEFMGFTNGKMKASEESSSLVTTDFIANISTYLFIFLLVISGCFFLLFMTLFLRKKIADKIKTGLTKFKNDMFFANSIKAQSATYLKTAISFLVFVRTINWEGHFFKTLVSLSPFMLIFVYPVGVSMFLIVMD